MSVSYMPTVRKPDFDWDKIETHYVSNNFFATHFLNSMHVVFPDGEKFFVRSVRNYVEEIKNPELKARVKAFIGQEMQHMNSHRTFWDMLRKQSPALEIFDKFYSTLLYGKFEETVRKTDLGNKLFLSVTTALEHYTSSLGEVVLENDCAIMSGIPEDMKDMLKWHAAEEIEHKAVAYDVLQEIDDSYVLRVVGMIFATASLSFFIFVGQVIFMYHDREMKLIDWPAHFVGFVKKASPLFKGLLERLGDYFRPNFHPDDVDNMHLAEEILKQVQERFAA
jgi:predicted metal-dependent hydrolase